jgi:hypothetical protein
MKRTKVDSSHIASVGYDSGTRVLHLEFSNGTVYEYKGVPEHYYRALSDAKSSGSAFHKYIKPHFHGRQI